MAFKFNDAVSNLNDALYPSTNANNENRLGVFGGQSFGFAGNIDSLFAKTFYQSKTKADPAGVPVGMNAPIPSSIFNEYALFNFRGMYGELTGSGPFNNYFDSPDNPLMGGSYAHNVTVAKLIEFFNTNYPKIPYKAQDFLYSKYYRKIPVNHLITLRRFPMPVEDNIFELTKRPAAKNEDSDSGDPVDVTQVAGVTAVSYLGETANNKLEDILNFSFGLNWREMESKMQEIESLDSGGYTSQPFYSKFGAPGRAVFDTLKGQKNAAVKRQLSVQDRLGQTYANFVLGPVNVIDKTYSRDRGLKFQNDIKLTFEYELKSLNYVNPKIAMIDIISNMLTMTTNNAQFFGGGQRYYGGAGYVASQFGTMELLRNGNFAGYIGSVVTDVSTGFKNAFGLGDGGFDVTNFDFQSLFKGGKTLFGNLLGGFLSQSVGAVGGTQVTQAMVSGEPTGNWHLTVGNPLNPIVMMGNMYCDNASMSMGSGLGYDDFPIEVKFEVDVKHGRPRDKGDIENMFNAGSGRIYAPAETQEDILNLEGKDVKVSGAQQDVGDITTSNTQSGSNTNPTPASDVKSDYINNLAANKSGSSNSVSGEYVESMIKMITKS